MIIEEFIEGTRTYKFCNDNGLVSVKIDNRAVLTAYAANHARGGTRANKIRSHGNTLIDVSRVRECYDFVLNEMGL